MPSRLKTLSAIDFIVLCLLVFLVFFSKSDAVIVVLMLNVILHSMRIDALNELARVVADGKATGAAEQVEEPRT